MFRYNPFKTQLIEAKIPEEGLTSAYRCGNLIDLCTGPHIPSAGIVKGFKVTKNSQRIGLIKKKTTTFKGFTLFHSQSRPCLMNIFRPKNSLRNETTETSVQSKTCSTSPLSLQGQPSSTLTELLSTAGSNN